MRRIFLSLSLFLIGLPGTAFGAGDIFISEVSWAGSSLSNADEWVELANPTGDDIPLAGWTLEGAATGGEALIFPEDAVIAASSTFIIANYPASHDNSSLASEPNWATTSVSLSNSSLALVLKRAVGTTVDAAGDGGAPPAGHSGETRATMTRIYGTDEWSDAASSRGFKDGIPDFGTPGIFELETDPSLPSEEPEELHDMPESPPRPAVPDPIVTAIRISEIFPAPETGDEEWIELVNRSSIGEFLDGWTVEDAKGTTTDLTGLILPWDRLVILAPKGALNNAGDAVLLKDAKGRIIDGMTYGDTTLEGFPHAAKPKRGESVIRPALSERFIVTDRPSPGEANLESLPEPILPEVVPPKPLLKKTVAPLPVFPSSDIENTPRTETQQATARTPRHIVTLAQTSPPVTPHVTSKVRPSRYKGAPYEAVVAVPPGPYGKTRMRIYVDGRLRALHLTRSPNTEFRPGQRIGFVAQEKSEGGRDFLLANLNSLFSIGNGEPFVFDETTSWPEKDGAYRLTGKVVSVSGREARIDLEGEEGIVHAPTSMNRLGLQDGDRVEVLGFFSRDELPEIVMPDLSSMRLLEPLSPTGESQELPRWLGFALLGIVFGSGIAIHLYRQRQDGIRLDEPLV